MILKLTDMEMKAVAVRLRQIVAMLALLLVQSVAAQDYMVESFELDNMDLTARTKPRLDANGRKCALLKVQVPDKIAQAQGNVIGEVESIGIEKLVYLENGSKMVKLIFENYYPLMINFKDYGYPQVSEQMTYIVKLREKAVAPVQPSPVIPQEEQQSVAEILKEAKAAYDDKNYDKAFSLFSKISDDAEAQNYIGVMYKNGYGVAQDYSQAVNWYRKAAEQGYADAQNNLGLMYDRGYGVVKDGSEAVSWYRKAAEQGYAEAQCNLGLMYVRGYGVPQDFAEAVSWFRKAAEQGYAKGQYFLGIMYSMGFGVTKNYSEALKWYRKAAEQGYDGAQYQLGDMYERGDGVAKDYTEAVNWYRKAADQGTALAQYKLGHMYEKGYGVAKDYTEAVNWYRKAADQGNTDAQKWLKKHGETY